jgi:hypothetical protein
VQCRPRWTTSSPKSPTDGLLLLSIYNDQGQTSRRWLAVKRLYNRLPAWSQAPYAMAVMLPFELRSLLRATVR